MAEVFLTRERLDGFLCFVPGLKFLNEVPAPFSISTSETLGPERGLVRDAIDRL